MAVNWQRRVSGGGCDEFVGRTKGNRLETDVEALQRARAGVAGLGERGEREQRSQLPDVKQG